MIMCNFPDAQKLNREAVLMWLDYYISTDGPLVGKADNFFKDAPEDISADRNAAHPMSSYAVNHQTQRYCAEIFITKLLNLFGDLGFAPEMSCMYLDRIANRPDMPDAVIDVAIAWQDRIIEVVQPLKNERDEIRAEYKHIISLKP